MGGTWYWNTYPGIAVDIPSYSYQFSFEKRPSWSRTYAPGIELKNYAKHCVEKYGLASRIRFGVTVVRAEFDEESTLWRLFTSTDEELTARFVINASGVLTRPKTPDIPGSGTSAGSRCTRRAGTTSRPSPEEGRRHQDGRLGGATDPLDSQGRGHTHRLSAHPDMVSTEIRLRGAPPAECSSPARTRSADRRAGSQPGVCRTHLSRRSALPYRHTAGVGDRACSDQLHASAGHRPGRSG